MERSLLKSEAFTQVNPPTLEDVLHNRELRVRAVEHLCRQYPGQAVICFKCNIPGVAKNNSFIQTLHQIGESAVLKLCDTHALSFKKSLDRPTGPETILVLNGAPENIKDACIQLELRHALGRLFDFDVEYLDEHGTIHTVSRMDLGYPERQCFICSKSAKECGRNRSHSLEALQAEILKLIETSVIFHDQTD